MSVIEAMLTGLPVVATDIRGPREQVVHGETGLLVPAGTVAPLAEALETLAADAPMRAQMGEAGRERARFAASEPRGHPVPARRMGVAHRRKSRRPSGVRQDGKWPSSVGEKTC